MTTVKLRRERVTSLVWAPQADPLRDYLDHLVTRRLGERHINGAHYMLMDLARVAGKPLLAVTKKDVKAWGADLARREVKVGGDVRPMAAATVRKYHTAARRFYAWALDEDLITADPTRGALVSPKLPKRLPKYMTREEVARLLAVVEGDRPLLIRDQAAFAIVYLCGMRAMEVIRLRREHIDRAAGLVWVIGKGNKERCIPVPSALWPYLDRVLAAFQDSPWVLGPWSYKSFYTAFHTARRRAGLPKKYHPHCLRHSYATHLLENGIEPHIIQQALGHADISTTMTYATARLDAAARSRISDALSHQP